MSVVVSSSAPPPPPGPALSFGDEEVSHGAVTVVDGNSQSFSSSAPSSSPSSSALASVPAEPTLTGIQPISVKKTLMIVNHFLITTTDFLNKFASLAEHKLHKVTQQIQRLDITLQLLEAKLESISWLSGGGGGAAPAAAPVSNGASLSGEGVPSAPSLGSGPEGVPSGSTEAAPAAAAAPAMAVKDDPRYAKYFKMLNMGVPKPALILKMQADGVDNPEVINMDPESAAPPGAPPSQALVLIENAGSSSDEEDQEYEED